MTEISWVEIDSHDLMGVAKMDGTIHIYPSKIYSSAKAVFDPILIPEYIERLYQDIAIVVVIEEILHNLFCDFIGIETTEHQDHEAMRWCYEFEDE